ncbi:sigma-70 family RNA polymerase sigma factor [Aquisphaera insulae]|uniref:sigma-70 family RNA polymerase sigma factor n=1 Tax=Aquisphaera insulae TaxID=2712864 RepID=UPI0013EB8CA5|nr:sigma-70 family RNA polymerase sigma factor [Aquisphaera insulae]
MSTTKFARTTRRHDLHTSPEEDALTPEEERGLLERLDRCRKDLAALEAGGDANASAAGDGVVDPRREEIRNRYLEIRSKLALGTFNLVTHSARRYRNRGIPYSDILQEGFCGLLEAIDRFDTSSSNRLAAYAIWWVRQRMQAAVAAGAYPVRLNPRCLRALAADRRRREQEANLPSSRGLDDTPDSVVSEENLVRLREVTRPTVWLDEVNNGESDSGRMLADPRGDATGLIDDREGVETLLRTLSPREREIIRLRFGLNGEEKHSLGEVSDVVGLSKERVRQIQEKALEKLRIAMA